MSIARLWQKQDSSAMTSTTDRTKVVSDLGLHTLIPLKLLLLVSRTTTTPNTKLHLDPLLGLQTPVPALSSLGRNCLIFSKK